MHIGECYRSSTIIDVAQEFRFDWKTVKKLNKRYQQEQLHGAQKPR
jgi:hypothetical protein